MKKYLLFSLSAAFFITGCIPGGSRDITDLKAEVAQMQIQYQELQKSQSSTDPMIANKASLSATIEELQNQIAALAKKVFDLEQKSKQLEAKAAEASGEQVGGVSKASPSEAFQKAYANYSMGKYDFALEDFQYFLEDYPDSEYGPQAQFYIGECLFSQNKFDKAIEEYKKVEQKYPKSDLVITAKLKMGLAYEKLDKKRDAMILFAEIARDYPETSEALTAKEKVKIYSEMDLSEPVKKEVKKDDPVAAAPAELPSVEYLNAYNDFSAGKFEIAYDGFKKFADKNPKSKYAEQAYFYMGDCFYSTKKWEKAIAEYKNFEQKYPKSALVPSSKLKTAQAYESLGKQKEAMNVYAVIVKNYPESTQAVTAKEKIIKYNDVQAR